MHNRAESRTKAFGKGKAKKLSDGGTYVEVNSYFFQTLLLFRSKCTFVPPHLCVEHFVFKLFPPMSSSVAVSSVAVSSVFVPENPFSSPSALRVKSRRSKSHHSSSSSSVAIFLDYDDTLLASSFLHHVVY